MAAEPSPNYSVLKVPDNGTLVDYMTTAAMNAVLALNFPDGAPLTAPQVYRVGLHPGSFGASYTSRLDAALTEVDHHLFADDAGPIVYARLTELTRVWR